VAAGGPFLFADSVENCMVELLYYKCHFFDNEAASGTAFVIQGRRLLAASRCIDSMGRFAGWVAVASPLLV
jgi:hypothetical protein